MKVWTNFSYQCAHLYPKIEVIRLIQTFNFLSCLIVRVHKLQLYTGEFFVRSACTLILFVLQICAHSPEFCKLCTFTRRTAATRASAPHSQLLYTDIPDTVTDTGSRSDLAAFRAGLESVFSANFWCRVCRHRVSPDERVTVTLRGAITEADIEILAGQLPNRRAQGPDELPFELRRHAPVSMKAAWPILDCINSIQTGEARPSRSWIVGLICFVLKRKRFSILWGTAHWQSACWNQLDTVCKIL